jgi:DNA ligase-1
LDLEKIYKIVLKLQNTPGRLDKMAILSAHKNDDSFRFWLKVNLDPFWIFGVQSKKIQKQSDVHIDSPFDDFKTMITYLKAHNTGRDIDCQKVAGFLNTFDDEELKQFTLDSVCKKVRLGASTKVVNSVFGKGFMSSFELQLAKKYADEKDKLLKKYHGDFWITQKLDGQRIIAINTQNGIQFFTRQGQIVTGLNDIEKEFKELPNNDLVYDGELILQNDSNLSSGDLYRETMKVSRSNNIKEGLIFNCFDLLSLKDFQDGESKDNYSARRNKIESIFAEYSDLKFVKKVPVLYDGNDWNIVKQLLNDQLSLNHEGIMLNLDLPYQCKRSGNILKCKDVNNADVRMIGFLEGQGKNKNKLGSAIFKYQGYNTEVGSGWTDALREDIWNNQDRYLNTIIEIEYTEPSKDKNGKDSIRFARFKRLRPDKTEESWY